MKRISFNPQFVNDAGDDLIPGKIHTIRKNYDYWKRYEGQELTLFTWDGKPYQQGSKQKVVCVKRLVSVQKIKKIKHCFWANTFAIVLGDGKYEPASMTYSGSLDPVELAKNDGFSTTGGFFNWFENYPEGTMAILHFTDFRYGGSHL